MQGYEALSYRVDSLEALLGEFIVHSRTSFAKLSREMISFKNEMKGFTDEMKDFKDEMKDFKDEMKDFKDEMKDFKDETKENHKQINREWGNLARKMGTVVEDIIAPAVRPAVRKYFGEDVVYFAINIRKKIKALGLSGEFDVVAVGETRVFLVEVKSTPREQYLDDFLENIEKFRKLFPEYADMPLVPIFGSIRFEDDFIPLATARGIYLLAYREWDYMDIVNFDNLAEVVDEPAVE